MKSLLIVIFGCFISIGALLATISMKNPFVGFVTAGIALFLVVRLFSRRTSKLKF